MAVPAVRLPRLLSRVTAAAHDVLAKRDRLEMVRIHAPAIPAQMIEYEPIRNAAADELERNSVRFCHAAGHLDVAVSSAVS